MHRERFFAGWRLGGRFRHGGPEGGDRADVARLRQARALALELGMGAPQALAGERSRFGGRGGGREGHDGPPPFGGRAPFPGPAFFRRHWGGGRRARRGDIRAAILALLAEKPMHGYDLIQELTERSGGLWHPSPGSVYPTLQMMEEGGLVVGEEVEGRRTFSLTEQGRAEHAARMERAGGAHPWQARDPAAGELVELREAAFQLGAAVMQIARLSSPAQIAEALAIVKDARRKLYRLLADAP